MRTETPRQQEGPIDKGACAGIRYQHGFNAPSITHRGRCRPSKDAGIGFPISAPRGKHLSKNSLAEGRAAPRQAASGSIGVAVKNPFDEGATLGRGLSGKGARAGCDGTNDFMSLAWAQSRPQARRMT